MNWEPIQLPADVEKFLRGEYDVFAKQSEGRTIFNIARKGEMPGETDGGYYAIDSMLHSKGLRP